MRTGALTAAGLLTFILASAALAHGGGLDANGCHHDRKRGGYHCHNGSPEPAPVKRDTPQTYEGNDNKPLGLFGTTSTAAPYEAEIEIVQKLLAKLGYDPGTPDGRMGPRTKDAITTFQKSEGLTETGEITMPLVDALIEKLAA